MAWFVSFAQRIISVGCGWTWPIMAAVSKGAIPDDEMNEAMQSHFKHSDDEAQHVPDKLKTWMEQSTIKLRRKSAYQGDALLWFMAWGCNSGMTAAYVRITMVYIMSRAASQLMYSALINALGAKWTPAISAVLLHVTGSHETVTTRLLTFAVIGTAILFSFISVLAAYTSYELDKQGKFLGIRIRSQLVWGIIAHLLASSTQHPPDNVTAGKLSTMISSDVMHVEWAVMTSSYLVTASVEIMILLVLSIYQVGFYPSLAGLIPLAIYIPISLLLASTAGKHMNVTHRLRGQRMDIANVGITFNSAIKLMKAEACLVGKMADLRRKEVKHTLWFSASNALTLSMQLSLATLMAFMVHRVNPNVSPSAIFAVLSYYRIIVGFDMNRLLKSSSNFIHARHVATGLFDYFFSLQETKSQVLCPPVNIRHEMPLNTINTHQSGSIEGLACNWPLPLVRDIKEVVSESGGDKFSFDEGATLHLQPKPLVGGARALSAFIKLIQRGGLLLGVAGPVGSGKTTLLHELMWQLWFSRGNTVAFSAQKVWIARGSLASVVTFGEEYKDKGSKALSGDAWLQNVIDACGLRSDVEGFPNGLEQDVGESGSMLSGGQRARVALARSAYARKQITLLDDPLCALDSQLRARVFDACMNKGGILRGADRTVVMISSDPLHLECCDMVLNLAEGKVVSLVPCSNIHISRDEFMRPRSDCFQEVQTEAFEPVLLPPLECHDDALWPKDSEDITNPLPQNKPLDNLQSPASHNQSKSVGTSQALGSSHMPDSSSIRNRHFCMKSSSGWVRVDSETNVVNEGSSRETPTITHLVKVLCQLYRASNLVLSVVAAAGIMGISGAALCWQITVPEYLDTGSPFQHIWMYIFVFLSLVFPFMYFVLMINGSSRMQLGGIKGIIASPLSFFSSTNPAAVLRTLLQDSQDIEFNLSPILGTVYLLLAQIILTVSITLISMPYLVALFVPLATMYWILQRSYSRGFMPLRTADAQKLEPVIAAGRDVLEGLITIRAFGKEDYILREQLGPALRTSGSYSSAVAGAASCLSFCTNTVIYGIMATVSSVTTAAAYTPSHTSIAPMIISNIFQLSGVMGALALAATTMENSLLSVDRLLKLARLIDENTAIRQRPRADDPLDSFVDQPCIALGEAVKSPPHGWPSQGSIVFHDLTASYALWGVRPALRDINFLIPGGSSCGIVGRSGSGKSTAVLALAGMIPIISGRCEIDGVDVRSVSLPDLRGAVAVVPQEPVIINGSLRHNLDLLGQRSDEEICAAVEVVGLSQMVQNLGGLDGDLPMKGSEISQGQKQLLCLARAMLLDRPLLVLDEAYASVDSKYDIIMNKVVSEFVSGILGPVSSRRRTLLVIAHRLTHVLALDQVLVLQAGELLESGAPEQLLEKKHGLFCSMVHCPPSME